MMIEDYLVGNFPVSGIDDELLQAEEQVVSSLDWEILPESPVRESEKIIDKPGAVVAVATNVEGDVDGNGLADVIMTITQANHPNRGSSGVWKIQENQTAAWGGLSKLGVGSVLFGFGKTASGKETNDVYYYDPKTKYLAAWITGANGQVQGWQKINKFNSNMNAVGLGDFNGDGQTDVLLRSDTGYVGFWFTSGAINGWKGIQGMGSEWELAAIGDFNGDGIDDVALAHDAGFAGCWLTQADGKVVWSNLDVLNKNELAGAGDFDGDGTDDILLKNGNYYSAWIVKNGNASSWMGLGSFNGVVEQIADFNGDGKDDLRIRVNGKQVGVELVNCDGKKLTWKGYGSLGTEWSTSIASI